MSDNIKKDFGNKRARKPDISSLVYGKVPPQAPEAEEALLGAVLLERDALIEAMQIIPSEDAFYVDAHQKIYGAIMGMHRDGKPIDLTTVTIRLRDKGELEIIGGAHYLTKLVMNVVSGAHVIEHARIVVQKFMLREVIRISGQMISEAYDDADPFDLQAEFITQFNLAFETKSRSAWISAKQAADMFLKERSKIMDNKGVVAISTTFTKLDGLNGGFKPGQLVILAARPSVGKSALAATFALQTAEKVGAVGIINLEMTTEETFGRLVSQDSGIDYGALERDHRLEQDIVTMAVSNIANKRIFFTQNTRMNIHDITSAAEYLKRKYDVKMLLIDYLQLLEGEEKYNKNREQEVAKMSRGLKTLAMGLRIPVIALSQLNRESDKRGDKKPTMGDLRESGAIEQDADVIMLLHRDFRVGITRDKSGASTEFEADLLVPKWRNGSPVELKLRFEPHIMKFSQAPDQPFTPTSKAIPSTNKQDDPPF